MHKRVAVKAERSQALWAADHDARVLCQLLVPGSCQWLKAAEAPHPGIADLLPLPRMLPSAPLYNPEPYQIESA